MDMSKITVEGATLRPVATGGRPHDWHYFTDIECQKSPERSGAGKSGVVLRKYSAHEAGEEALQRALAGMLNSGDYEVGDTITVTLLDPTRGIGAEPWSAQLPEIDARRATDLHVWRGSVTITEDMDAEHRRRVEASWADTAGEANA